LRLRVEICHARHIFLDDFGSGFNRSARVAPSPRLASTRAGFLEAAGVDRRRRL